MIKTMSDIPDNHADARESRPFKGIFLTVLGIGCITFNDALMKLIVADHPIGEAIFVRGLFALVPIAFLIYRAGGITSLRIHDTALQVWCVLLLVGPPAVKLIGPTIESPSCDTDRTNAGERSGRESGETGLEPKREALRQRHQPIADHCNRQKNRKGKTNQSGHKK